MKIKEILSKGIIFSALAVSGIQGVAAENHSVLKVGYNESGGAALGFIAEYKKFFDEEKVKVEFVPFIASSDGLNALQSSKIDVGLTFGTSGPLTFISKGSDINVIGGHLSGGSPILALPGNAGKFKTLADFKGKKVGSVRLYTSDVVFRSALAEAGIDWKKDIDIIEFKTGAGLLEALKSKKVDVAFGVPSLILKAREAGIETVMWSNDLMPGHTCCRIIARKIFIDKNRVSLVAFIQAIIRAERAQWESPELVVDASMPHFKLERAQVESMFLEPHQIFQADPNKKEVIRTWNNMLRIGYIEPDAKSIDIAKHIDTGLYKDALDSLSQRYPDDPFYKVLKERFEKQDL